MTAIFKKLICKDPGQFLLWLPPLNRVMDVKRSKLLNKLLLLTRKCILFNWISEKPPSVTQWYKEIFRVFPMERLSAKLKGNDDTFMDIWRPLMDYLPKDLSEIIQRGNSGLEGARLGRPVIRNIPQ